MSSFISYGEAQQAGNEIPTDNSSVFVIPSQVVAGATSTGVTYNMSVTGMAPSDASKVKYDYIFDYTLADAAAAASFCNAFTVSGANAYSTTKNNQATAALSTPADVGDILIDAFANAVAEANQDAQDGVPTKTTLAGSEKIDDVLTSILKQFVNAYTAPSFDGKYYSEAVKDQAGLSTDEVNIDLDNDTGVSALKRATAAADAVKAGGAIREDATRLHLQIPASNLRLYENLTTSTLSNALLLKGGDTVVIGFSVTLDNPQAACALSSSGAEAATNSSAVPNTHPAQLEAETLNVFVNDGPSAIRAVEIAIRLHMPGSGAIAGVRAA